LGLDNGVHRAHAEETQRVIDEEVSRLLRQAEQRATDLLTTYHQALYRLIDLLQERETVDGAEVYAIINSDRAEAVEGTRGASGSSTTRTLEGAPSLVPSLTSE
jgi:cell division protease FtsH